MRQQDAHEGLTYTLDLIHDSINKAKSKTYHEEGPQSSSEALVQRRRRDDSYVWDMFGGQLQSKLVCQRCQHKSLTFDHFTHLSLELPSASPATLHQCLKTFTTLEQVEWDCTSCKHRSVPSRMLQISSLPKLLILHLKRFRQTLSGESRKIETFIKFPIENLDLEEFISYKSRNPVRTYNLYAIINQKGSLSSGHYTAFVKRKGRWFLCNDSHVTPVADPFNVVTSDAYLLFYYRVDLKNIFD
jgi:ubiquitin C-terminal hydrolase